ncbi:RidA family protein [Agrobacterium sp. S2/73]|uniref:RidA family protein n=1 Tax=Agrobacterium TaxID=357 RepID=UPI000DD99469|nr:MULTISPECIES: RidA family protein [unclassified Agrobacterium]MBO9112072.1 RidA family protein [Agrobacterium sp. S2/73]NTA13397.1 RidA family protein [Agrobacterium tumefaciens]QXZ76420.1 RidA family protein [Agrobacterium sp. S7/73]
MSNQSNHQPSTRVKPVVVHNGVAHVSGQLPRENGVLALRGKVGAEVSVVQAQSAAALSINACLEQLRNAIGPEGRIERIIKITGFVASAPGFNQQGAVIDAASDILLDQFGPSGAHARSAVGVAELPHGAPVEIEMIAAVTI